MARTLVPTTEVTPPKATLTTSLTGTNNDLVFTAAEGGSWGNAIQVAYIDPGGTTAALSVVVGGFLITVNLARAASAIVTTANDILAAVQANLDAQALVGVALAGSNDGTGVVTALSAASLAGGSYATTLPAATNGDSTNGHYITGNAGDTAIKVISSDGSARNVTVKRSPILRPGAPPSDEVISVPAGATVELGCFPPSEFNQNRAGDVYFDPAVSNTLDFIAYKVPKAA